MEIESWNYVGLHKQHTHTWPRQPKPNQPLVFRHSLSLPRENIYSSFYFSALEHEAVAFVREISVRSHRHTSLAVFVHFFVVYWASHLHVCPQIISKKTKQNAIKINIDSVIRMQNTQKCMYLVWLRSFDWYSEWNHSVCVCVCARWLRLNYEISTICLVIRLCLASIDISWNQHAQTDSDSESRNETNDRKWKQQNTRSAVNERPNERTKK